MIRQIWVRGSNPSHSLNPLMMVVAQGTLTSLTRDRSANQPSLPRMIILILTKSMNFRGVQLHVTDTKRIRLIKCRSWTSSTIRKGNIRRKTWHLYTTDPVSAHSWPSLAVVAEPPKQLTTWDSVKLRIEESCIQPLHSIKRRWIKRVWPRKSTN